MFRKRTKKVGAKNNLRRKRAINENAIDGGDNNKNNEEDDDSDDDEQNDYTQIGLSIRKTMKKQKILASMPMTTPGGVSSSSFPRNNKNNNQSNNNSNNNNDDNNSNNNKDNDGNDQSFMAKKHQNNMEDFIEKQIATNNDTIANARPKGNAEEDLSTKDEDDNSNNNSNNSEEGLYKQLAREVTNTGETGSGGGENKNNNNDNMVDSRNDADEDQGALLVGTGIAEVILPTTSHRPVASSTSMGYVRNTNNLFLSSAVPENQRHKHKMPDTTPKPFVKFRKQYNVNNNNNNNQDNNNSNNQTNNNSNSNSNNEHQQKDNAHDNVNNTRQGFDAFRGKETPSSSSDKGNDRDNNNNRGKRTGKSRDDQAYGHFMKTAIAGRKMR